MARYSSDQRRAGQLTRRAALRAGMLSTLGLAGASMLACGGSSNNKNANNAANNKPAANTNAAGTAASGATAAATAGGPSGSPAAAVRGGTLNFSISGEPPDLDPTGTLSFGLHTVIAPIYSRIIRTAWPSEATGPADLSLKADLAEKWEQVDLQTYTFHLRPNAAWHNVAPVNGRPVTAADVKAALGVYSAGGAQKSAFDIVDTIDTPDDHTVTIKMKTPYALFLDTLANPVRHIFPPEAVSRPSGLKTTPVIGSGPFMFKDYQRGQAFSGVRNPNYYMPNLPYLDGYQIRFVPQYATQEASFRTNALDIIAPGSWTDAQTLTSSDSHLHMFEGKAAHSVFSPAMDLTQAPFQDPRVRQAISLASDRKTILKTIYGDHGIIGWGVPWVFVQDTPWSDAQLGQWYTYDPAQAKKLLAAAGFAQGFDTTMIFYPYSSTMQPQIELFQAQLKQNLGINITLKQLDYTTWFTTYTGMQWHGMAWGFQIGTSSTIDDFMYNNLHTKSSANYYYIADPNIDALVEKIRQEPDATARKQLIKQVFDIDQAMVYRLGQPYGNGFEIAHPKLQGWTPETEFHGLTAYGSSEMATVWFSA
jgi:peptide/nickel transport system substrate-binding protein